MIYLIQVTLYTAVLYIVYLLFLKNKTSHNWSRAYLLMNMVVPIILPFIRIPVAASETIAAEEAMLPVVTVGQQVAEQAEEISVLPIVYVAVCCMLLGYFIAQVVQVAMFIKRHGKESRGGVKLLRNTSMGPGSWFNYVFIPGGEVDEAILRHEMAHVQLRHSYDIILTAVLRCLLWPNAMLWLIGKELKTVHEFQADVYAGEDVENYSNKLLAEVFHAKHFQVSHTFFHNPIKRRIMMLRKTRSRFGKMPTLTAALLLISGVLFAQSKKIDQSKTGKENASEKKSTAAPTDPTMPNTQNPNSNGVKFPLKVQRISDDEVDEAYRKVDKMPEFNGDVMEYLGRTIVYPKVAKQNKIQGRVTAKFYVNEQGNIEDISIVKSPHEALSACAIDAIRKMPKWKPAEKDGKPVRVAYMLPIVFKL